MKDRCPLPIRKQGAANQMQNLYFKFELAVGLFLLMFRAIGKCLPSETGAKSFSSTAPFLAVCTRPGSQMPWWFVSSFLLLHLSGGSADSTWESGPMESPIPQQTHRDLFEHTCKFEEKGLNMKSRHAKNMPKLHPRTSSPSISIT